MTVGSTEALAGELPAAFHAGRKPLSFIDKAQFATGDLVDGIVNYGVGTFIFYYLTAVCGISGTVTGTILVLSTCSDAFLDPLIGSVSDNTRSRFGRRLPYMFIAAFPTALFFGLLFSIPLALKGALLAVYVGFILLGLRLSTSFYFLPYAAVSAELSTEYSERSLVFAYRTLLNCVGNVILLVLGYYVFMHGQAGLLNHTAYVGFAWTCAAIALAGALTSAFAVSRMRGRLRPVEPGGLRSLRIATELREISQNRSFWYLFLCCLLFWTAIGLAATLGIHANLYFWHLPANIIGLLPLINIVGYAVGVPLCTLTLRWFEKRNVAIIGLALACSTLAIPVLLQLLGVLPQGNPLYAILGVVAFLGGMAGTFAFVPWGSMMSDAADEHELLFGSRREGLYFAGLFLSVKAAAGVGGFLGGLCLDLIHFPRDVASIATHPLPHDVVTNLGLVQGPLAAVVGMLSALMLLGYRIDRSALERIQSAIAKRHTRGAAPP
jgi:GPH family glycoside/pentoside/hexuronide:cation symporter